MPPSPAAPRIAPVDLLITAVFGALLIVNIAHHELWRDETLAWMIARTSDTPLQIFHALHYDGHPGLWHGMLWPLTRLTANPAAMQALHAVIALALIALVGLASPFRRWERVLLLGGYYLSYEYTVISRNYAIGILLALLHVHARLRAPTAITRNTLLLALLANTNIFAGFLSGALALDYARDRLMAGTRLRQLLPGALLYAAGLALAMATVWPAADRSLEIAPPLTGALDPGHMLASLIRFVSIGLVPAMDMLPTAGYHALVQENATFPAALPFLAPALAILATALLALRGHGAATGIFLLTTLLAALFGHFIYAIALRHWGIVFVAFIACLWLARGAGARPNAYSAALLAIGLLTGLRSEAIQWIIPFSMAGPTARWITASPYASRPLIGWKDAHTANIAAHLGRDLTMLQCRCTAPRAVFNRARDGFTRDQIPATLASLATTPSLFLSTDPLTAEEIADLRRAGRTTALVSSQTGAWTDENFWIYAVDPALPQ